MAVALSHKSSYNLGCLGKDDFARRLNILYERILVPLDGSELAQIALPYAEKLAKALGSQLILIYVSESDEDRYHHMHQFYLQQMTEAAKQDAERFQDRQGAGTIKVDSVITVGDPAEEIVEYASKQDIGLIVMSTHGRSGIKRWAMGSVADKVLRATSQPIALIRAKGARPDMLGERTILSKLLVALDGSKESEAVIPYIEELASKLQAEVILLQVIAPDYHIYAAGGPEYGVYAEQQIESMKKFARDYLEEIITGLKQREVTAKAEIVLGTAAETIINFADQTNASLVAMTTHGRSGVSRWAIGSVAERVMRAGNTPLLLVRSPGAPIE
jgi:nucleotide-binding universal stress UspA family protein